MKPTLMILAAGMGSRYGGLKQVDGVGPFDETIIEYSIFDAIRFHFPTKDHNPFLIYAPNAT